MTLTFVVITIAVTKFWLVKMWKLKKKLYWQDN